ncbi:hypothetical protein DO73_4630 [Burkholderia pseudomallei]|nr:hypothetical protein DO73_4630 [Burkholderia pseudomallei]
MLDIKGCHKDALLLGYLWEAIWRRLNFPE